MEMRTDERVDTLEAARRLGIPVEDVYRLIFSGALDGRPGSDGRVTIAADTISAYLERGNTATGTQT